MFLDTTRDPRPGEENGKGELALPLGAPVKTYRCPLLIGVLMRPQSPHLMEVLLQGGWVGSVR